MRWCWSGFRTPIEWYQNKLLSSHLQAADVQNATNKVTFAKSTPSDAFYYTCTSNGLVEIQLYFLHIFINELVIQITQDNQILTSLSPLFDFFFQKIL